MEIEKKAKKKNLFKKPKGVKKTEKKQLYSKNISKILKSRTKRIEALVI